MTDGRTISVVMCTYNGAKFVAEQIESIIGQTYPIYELIIQDDHSTDGTWEVLQGYQRKYPFIKVYMNESGKGVNRNFFSAFYRATGDFIAISDQDDIWEPRKLEWQVEAIGDAWLCAGMTRPFSDTNGVKTFFDERVANRCLERTIYCSMIAGHTMLFKRALLDKIPDWAYWSDYFLYDHFLQIVVESYEKLVYLDRVLVNQRRHLQAVTYSEPMNYAKTPMNCWIICAVRLRIIDILRYVREWMPTFPSFMSCCPPFQLILYRERMLYVWLSIKANIPCRPECGWPCCVCVCGIKYFILLKRIYPFQYYELSIFRSLVAIIFVTLCIGDEL